MNINKNLSKYVEIAQILQKSLKINEHQAKINETQRKSMNRNKNTQITSTNIYENQQQSMKIYQNHNKNNICW